MLLGLATTVTRTDAGFPVSISIKPIVRADLRSATRIRSVMAADLRSRLALDGGVTADDLKLIGWTQAQIDTHSREAIQLARRQAGTDADC